MTRDNMNRMDSSVDKTVKKVWEQPVLKSIDFRDTLSVNGSGDDGTVKTDSPPP
jgi:hypothetical protein